MQFKLVVSLLCALLVLSACSTMVRTPEAASNKVKDATQVFTDLDKSIPPAVLKAAKAILVIPEVQKLAVFGLGGEAGLGILSKLNEGTGRWSNPIFVNTSGASAGLQLGVKSTDVVLLITNYGSVDNILTGKLSLGVGAGVSAGPTGADAKIDTATKIYSYTRSGGLYAGVSLEGLVLSVNNEVNATFYGKEAAANDILAGKVPTNSDAVRAFQSELSRALRK